MNEKNGNERKGQIVLVAEDIKTDALLLARAIKKTNIKMPVQFVSDGEQTIAYLEGIGNYSDRTAFPWPAIIVLDLKLPRRDGFEILEWLRTQDWGAELPVIIYSSSARQSDIDRALKLGADDYVVKQVDSSELIAAIRLRLEHQTELQRQAE